MFEMFSLIFSAGSLIFFAFAFTFPWCEQVLPQCFSRSLQRWYLATVQKTNRIDLIQTAYGDNETDQSEPIKTLTKHHQCSFIICFSENVGRRSLLLKLDLDLDPVCSQWLTSSRSTYHHLNEFHSTCIQISQIQFLIEWLLLFL